MELNMFPLPELPLLFNGIYVCRIRSNSASLFVNTQPSVVKYLTLCINSLKVRFNCEDVPFASPYS